MITHTQIRSLKSLISHLDVRKTAKNISEEIFNININKY